jgi:hypothetical protein
MGWNDGRHVFPAGMMGQAALNQTVDDSTGKRQYLI